MKPRTSVLLGFQGLGGLLPQSRPVKEADGREAVALVFQELQMRQFSDEEYAFGFAKR